ncbi:MAG: glycosyltransferase family 9 protein [Deltaproteobacteria bacterium]|nr:glycosyltransferase family 9 protein [Deltaproteobacteria bacterium]
MSVVRLTSDIRGKRLLIMKLRYIGDTLSILPVIDNLKAKAPEAIVDVMVNRGTETVLEHHPGIRKVWSYDRKFAKQSILNTVRYHLDLIDRLRSMNYDIVIDFTHGDRAAFLAFATGAPERISYRSSSSLSHILMNRFIHCDPFEYHVVDYQLQALRFLGMDQFKQELTLHIPSEVFSGTDRLLADCGLGPEAFLAAIHPGARGGLRRWPVERYAEIARRLHRNYAASILLLGGPDEGALVDSLERSMGFQADFKSSRLTILEMAAILARCRFFIGNDSAPAHIAAAVGCPGVTLFGPTFPHLWKPLSRRGDVVFKNLPCCGCRQEKCLHPGNSCMDRIDVEEVWGKAQGLLQR